MKQATGIPIQLPSQRPQYVSCEDLLLPASTSSRQPKQPSIPLSTPSVVPTTSQSASSASTNVPQMHLSKSISTSMSTSDVDGTKLDSSLQPEMLQYAELWKQQPCFSGTTNWQINPDSEYQTYGDPPRSSNSPTKSKLSQDAFSFDQAADESMLGLLYGPSFPMVPQQDIWPTSTEKLIDQPFCWPVANISDNLAHLHILPNEVQSASVRTAQKTSVSMDAGHRENPGSVSNRNAHAPPPKMSNEAASISDDDDDDVQLLFVGPASKRVKKHRKKKRDDQNAHESLADISQRGNSGLDVSHVVSLSSKENIQVGQKSIKSTLSKASDDRLSGSSPSKARTSPKNGKSSKAVKATSKDTPQPQMPDLSSAVRSGTASIPTNSSAKASKRRRKSSSPQNQSFQDDMPLTKRTIVPKRFAEKSIKEKAEATLSRNSRLPQPAQRGNVKVESTSANGGNSEARVPFQIREDQQISAVRLLSQHDDRNSDTPQPLGPPRERRLSEIPQWPGSGAVEFSHGQSRNTADSKHLSGFSKTSRNQASGLPKSAEYGRTQSIRSNPDVNHNFNDPPLNQRRGSRRPWRSRTGSYHQARQPAANSEQRRPSISQHRPPVPNFPPPNPGSRRPSSTTSLSIQRNQAPPPLEPLPAASSTAPSQDIYLDIATTCKMNFPYAMIAERHAVSLQRVYDLFTDVVEVPLRQASARYQRSQPNPGGEKLQSRIVDGQRKLGRGSQQLRNLEN